MAVPAVKHTPQKGDPSSAPDPNGTRAVADGPAGHEPIELEQADRYRRLHAGSHGLGRDEVEANQRSRLQSAIVELIARHGYHAVRVRDVTKLAHISRPTFYKLYADKDELVLAAYDDIARQTASTVLGAYDMQGSKRERLRTALRAFLELAAAEPDAISLLVLGAFGGGAKAREHRSMTLTTLEERIRFSRDRIANDGRGALGASDHTVMVILGGIREVTGARLRQRRGDELPGLADELVAWAAGYPPRLPAGLRLARATPAAAANGAAQRASERARRAGRLPGGRHELSREAVINSQRERIVDATAAIVAEKGLAGLTIPAIAARAQVSHETFYELYPTKHDAFLGAQKVGMHQALGVAVEAYDAHGEDWPRAIAAGIGALIEYIASEPDHAHLSVVDTFAAVPAATEIHDNTLRAFAAYLGPGYGLAPAQLEVPAIAAEATAGGIWQVLNHYIDNGRIGELPGVLPQVVFLALSPFLGAEEASNVACA